MSFATVYSRAVLGVEAIEVIVETHLSNGLPGFAIVGLPETAVKESKERVRSAIINAGLEFPARRITVNLAPADLPKTGGKYDLAIALSILAASGQLDKERLRDCEILGELALDGSLRKIPGIVPAIVAAKRQARRLLLPLANQQELGLVGYDRGACSDSLLRFVDHLRNGTALAGGACPPARPETCAPPELQGIDIRGQARGKRAVEVAAAGGHHLLLVGPPGCGKTLLGNTLVATLPSLDESEALELAAVRSVAGIPADPANWYRRPMRAPHHSATGVALVGGGSKALPGEISLAHHGVLFLDELAEFKQGVLDSLREPLESGEITVSRANYRVRFPARFQLMAAMNPCPCGFASDPTQECRCSPDRIRAYLSRLSGPLLDRLDLLVEVPGLSRAELLQQEADPTDWNRVRDRVAACRRRQLRRQGTLNARLAGKDIEHFCGLGKSLRRRLVEAMEKLGMSARATHRILKVARTIADIREGDEILEQDLQEAIGFRRNRLLQSAASRV